MNVRGILQPARIAMQSIAGGRHRRLLLETALVFAVALVPRLVGIGLFLTADEKNWIGRSYEFLRAFREFRINDTLQTTHPGITTLWVAGLSTFVATRVFHTPFNFDDLHRFVTFAQVPMAVGNALLVAGLFLALRLLLPPRLALVGSLVVALDPFLIGYSKVVHVDAFLAGFLTIAALLVIVAEETRKEWALTASAVVGALAILTKMPGVFIIPFMLLVLFSRSSAWRLPEFRRRLRFFGHWLFFLVLTVLLLWPSLLWVPNPLGNANQVRKDMVTAFLTPHHMEESYTLNPWHYPATLLTRSTPLVLIGVVGLIVVLCVPQGRVILGRLLSRRRLFLLLSFAVFFFLMMMVGAKKGDRYLLPMFPLFDVLGAVGIFALLSLFLRRVPAVGPRILRITAGVLLLPLVITLLWVGPYALAYYNPLVPHTLGQELGWGEGLDQVARFLDREPGDARVASWYPEELRALTKKVVLHINAHEQEHVGYVVLYRNMFGRAPDHWANDFIDEYYRKHVPSFVACVNNLPYAWVYKKPRFSGVVGRLGPGNVVVVELPAVADGLSRIDVATATYSGTASGGTFVVRVRDTLDGPDLRRVAMPVAALPDRGFAEFTFPPITEIAGKTISVLLSTEGSSAATAPTVRVAPLEKETTHAVVTGGVVTPSAVTARTRPGLLGVQIHYLVDGRERSHEEIENAGRIDTGCS